MDDGAGAMLTATPPAPHGAIEALRAEALQGGGVRHGFFTRAGGASRGLYASLNAGPGSADDPAAVAENLRRVAAHLGVPGAPVVTMHQTHSADALVVDGAPAERPRVDALATRTRGLVLGALAADCAPILLRDASAGVIGAAHAGWRGAFGGILEAAVGAMERIGARRERIAAAIGPTIGPASYEVGPEFVARFEAAGDDAARFFRPAAREGHAMFDLPAYAAARLSAMGLASVQDLGVDTYADEARFFSYRRATHGGEADYGRLISAIVLAD